MVLAGNKAAIFSLIHPFTKTIVTFITIIIIIDPVLTSFSILPHILTFKISYILFEPSTLIFNKFYLKTSFTNED